MKFTSNSNVSYTQVLADAEIRGTFVGPAHKADALNLATKLVAETGTHAVVYTFTHEAIAISP